ncbi:hypothetical protein [Imhoffiella purpurea]|uniref:Uncharacterized protein n=1 Tax=Imhoffiella purpurea TaxID=1249627 RepID=W9V8N0_9GAMM|nr:hypothetical protein [Imhoffiella purpurea]EXJ13236.1 hypothetical protein D779_3914 [Imhoffiella purpurea]
MDAADLADLAERFANRPPETPEGALSTGIRRWLAGEVDSLDAALELGGAQGQERALTRWRRLQRNASLREALECCEGASPWRRCLALESEIARFESVIWPRWQALSDPPSGSSALRVALFRAKQFGSLPSSARQISNILRNH